MGIPLVRAARPLIPVLVRAGIERPRALLLAFAMLVLLAAPGLLRLDLQLDGLALVPPEDPAVTADAATRRTFGLQDQIVIFIASPGAGKILDAASLGRVRDLTHAIFDYEEIERRHIMSLASEARDRIESWDYAPFLLPLPQTPQELESLRADIEASSIVKGTLVAPDYSGAAILVQVPEGADRRALYRKIRVTVAGIDAGDDRIHIVGAPVAEILLGEHLLADLARLLPLCGLLLSAALWWAFGRVWAIAIVLAHVGGCLVFTFGLMGWAGQPVYITTAVLPVILCTMGIAAEVHLLVVAQRVLRERAGNGSELALAVMSEIHRPLTLTVLSTAIGFASFLTSDLPPVRSFGLWATIGTLFSLAWSLCVTPGLYRVLGSRRIQARGRERRSLATLTSSFDRWSRARWMPVGVGAILLLLAAGTLQLEVQDGWISGFARGGEFHSSVERVNESLLGTHLLQLHLSFRSPPADASGSSASVLPPFRSPAVIEATRLLEEQVRAQEGVGGVVGPYSHLSMTRYLVSGRIGGSEKLAGDSTELRRLWRQIEFARGVERRQEIVNDAMDQGLVTIFLKDANYADSARLMAHVRQFAAETLAPLGGRVHFAGDVAVSQAMIAANVRGQLQSIGFGIVTLFAFLLLVLRRVSAALFAVVPVTVACLAVLGLMGWLAIPVGVATSMFIAITLGIGIDFPLHLLQCIERERAAGAPDPIGRAKAIIGPAIVIDSLVVSAGFGTLVFSQVPANARLGALVAITVLACCACTLLLTRAKRERTTVVTAST